MSFGEGRGKFDVWLPGKLIEAFCIEDVPNPMVIGPYRNIVLHVGVNNIKRRDRRSNTSLANELDNKCKEILELHTLPLQNLPELAFTHKVELLSE